MVRILIATKNRGKIKEIETLLEGLNIEVLGLDQMPPVEEPVEDGKTFRDNALKKARHYWDAFGINTLAEDSGLEVFALGGAPGVLSARYAGDNATDRDNIEKLLKTMKDIPEKDRGGGFVAVVCFIYNGRAYFFEGQTRGRIATEARGTDGFGYDPVFIPEGYDKTFAELGLQIKNKLSHRARAIERFREFLEETLREKTQNPK